MKCKEIRDLLTADYIDGELDDDTHKEVARHIESCAQCRLYEETVRGAAIEPFRKVRRCSAPARVWRGIKRRIEEKPEKGLRTALHGAWQSFFGIRKTAFVTAAAAAVIVIAAVLFRAPSAPPGWTRLTSNDIEKVNDYIQEQFLVLSYLGDNGTGSAEGGENGYFGIASVDFGTAVEEYLL
ncbi:MAG: anti-sigma factor [Candidatus Tritonobacter lacicola]|nr:anti-sigma factor [Candidatus Tritonobacter lacicola]